MSEPYLCPVCNGCGKVDGNFYTGLSVTATIYTTCQSCNGTGIIWSQDKGDKDA